VARVGREAPRRLRRGAQPVEHLVERPREVADLLRALLRERRPEVLGPVDPRGPGAQPPQRPHGDRREAPRRDAREQEGGEPESGDEPADPGDALLDRREGGEDLQAHVAAAGGGGERSPRVAADLDRREPVLGRDGGGPVRHVAAPHGDLAVHEDLHERPAARQQRVVPPRSAEVAASPPAGTGAEGGPGDRRRPLAQAPVDRLAAVALDRRQEHDGGDGADQGERGEGRDGDPRPQAPRRPHGRSTQPTPRTVWSTRGSPPSSSLRRTYPTKTSTTFVSTSAA
jgi:hypothetical protein